MATSFLSIEISLSLYGKYKIIKIPRFIGIIQGLGEVAVVVVKEKRKRHICFILMNTLLSTIDAIKYYDKR